LIPTAASRKSLQDACSSALTSVPVYTRICTWDMEYLLVRLTPQQTRKPKSSVALLNLREPWEIPGHCKKFAGSQILNWQWPFLGNARNITRTPEVEEWIKRRGILISTKCLDTKISMWNKKHL
jgi:hypothetical protein